LSRLRVLFVLRRLLRRRWVVGRAVCAGMGSRRVGAGRRFQKLALPETELVVDGRGPVDEQAGILRLQVARLVHDTGLARLEYQEQDGLLRPPMAWKTSFLSSGFAAFAGW